MPPRTRVSMLELDELADLLGLDGSEVLERSRRAGLSVVIEFVDTDPVRPPFCSC